MLVNKSYFLDMANTTREISNVCRFCLCQQGLIPFSKATASLLTIQDIQHFTGIQITDEELLSYAMCDKCCKVLKNSVSFRSTCMDNDVIFKQLFSVLFESVIDDLEEFKETKEPKNETLNVKKGQQIGEVKPHFICMPIATETEDTGPSVAQSNILNSTQCSKQRVKHSTADYDCTISETQFQKNIPKPDDKIRKRCNTPREMELCATCGKIVSCIYKHIANQHAKEKTFTCPHCQIEMKNRANMMRHINAVHKKKIVKSCEQCGQGFMHKNSYLSHMQSQHGIGDTFECTVCAKTFKLAAYYRAHMRVWHSTKEYPCTSCAMVFNKRKSLTIHQRVHSTEQPYACHLCPKRFKSSYARKTHELTHSGIRFQCTICDKSYRYKSLLSMHYRKDHEGASLKEATDKCKKFNEDGE